MDYTYHCDSPLGGITMACDGESLTGLWFDGQKYFADTLSAGHTGRFLPVFAETCRWLDLYFSGKIPDFTPPLAPRGSEFRRTVWKILLGVPYGHTVTYGWIAEKAAGQTASGRMSAQAVGGAVAHNPVSLIIPCHPAGGADGSLTGYAGGISKKLFLLQMEQGGSVQPRS